MTGGWVPEWSPLTSEDPRKRQLQNPPGFIVTRPDADRPWEIGDEVTVYKADELVPADDLVVAALRRELEEARGDCEHCGDMRSQLSAAEAERDRMRPVVEAAETYAHARYTSAAGAAGDRLSAAVDAWLRMERT